MKFIFLNLLVDSVELKKFLAEQKKKGAQIITLPELGEEQLINFIRGQFKTKLQLKRGDEVWAYTSQKLGQAVDEELSFDAGLSVPLLVQLRRVRAAEDDYWYEERKRVAMSTLTKFFSKIKAYRKILDYETVDNRVPYRNKLYQERKAALVTTLKSLQPKNNLELLNAAAHFLQQWGSHIAEVPPHHLRRLQLDEEKQFPEEFTHRTLYFRSYDGFGKNPLITAYINSFARGDNLDLHSKLCIPVDSVVALEEGIPGFSFLVQQGQISVLGAKERSTKAHSLLVFQKKDDFDDYLKVIFTLGLMPTPAKMLDRIIKKSLSYKVFSQPTNKPCLKLPSFASLEELMVTDTYLAYEKLAQQTNPELPALRIYCAAISAMLKGLNELLKERCLTQDKALLLQQSYGFIHQYIEWVLLYRRDHRRITNFSEWLIEELIFSLLILTPYPVGEFSQLMKEQLLSLHQKTRERGGIDFSLGLFNSGMSAFYHALIASLGLYTNPRISCTTNIYSEIEQAFNYLNLSVLMSSPYRSSENADIYLINPSTCYSSEAHKIYPVNLVDFVERIFARRTQPGLVTLLIDSTLMNKDDEMLHELLLKQAAALKEGRLNLVFFESLQKYGMFGTDKVEAGFVWAINNPAKFAAFNQQIMSLAKQNQYFDAQFICHLTKYAFPQLQESFLLNCKNGERLRRMTPKDFLVHHSKQSPFLYFNVKTPRAVAIKSFCIYRGSFGFSQMVMTVIGNKQSEHIRVSAGYEGRAKLAIIADKIANAGSKNFYHLVNKLELYQHGFEDQQDETELQLFGRICCFLYKPQFRTLLCSKAEGLLRYIQYESQPHQPTDLLYKIYQFSFMNLLLRFHAIPLPPEFFAQAYEQLLNLKLEISQQLVIELSQIKLLANVIFAEGAELSCDLGELERLRKSLLVWGNWQANAKLADLISCIDDYLLINISAKLERKPFLFLLAFSFCEFFNTAVESGFDLQALQANFRQQPREESGHAKGAENILLQMGGRVIHLFFNKAREAREFCQKAGLAINPSLSLEHQFIDADRKYARDPVIARQYQRPVVKISSADYLQLLENRAEILPVHEPRRILAHSYFRKQQIPFAQKRGVLFGLQTNLRPTPALSASPKQSRQNL